MMFKKSYRKKISVLLALFLYSANVYSKECIKIYASEIIFKISYKDGYVYIDGNHLNKTNNVMSSSYVLFEEGRDRIKIPLFAIGKKDKQSTYWSILVGVDDMKNSAIETTKLNSNGKPSVERINLSEINCN